MCQKNTVVHYSLHYNKGPSSQDYGFSSGHVWIWQLDYKESWVPKNWCFWTVVLKKTLENPLDCKEIQPVHPKGDQSWVFIVRTDVETETPILGYPMQRPDSLEKTLMLGKIEGRRRRGRQRMRWLDGLIDSMDMGLGGLPGLMQTHVHRVGDAIHPSHPPSSPPPLAFSLSQHQGLFQWVSSWHQVVRVLESQLQHQSFQWTFRTDLL